MSTSDEDERERLQMELNDTQDDLYRVEQELRDLKRLYLECRDERDVLQDRVVALEGGDRV